jgi:hypothetical protein
MKRPDPLEMEVMAEPVARVAMTRAERIERWATLLDEHDGRIVPLPGIEYMREEERRQVSGPNYPMTVAFADPVFRALGLQSEKLGDALNFFEISDDEAHHLMCECVSTGEMIAGRLHRYAKTGVAGFGHIHSMWGRA